MCCLVSCTFWEWWDDRFICFFPPFCFRFQKCASISLALSLAQNNLQGEGHPKPKLSMLFALSQSFQHFFKNDMIILKQIVKETQKWPNGSGVIDQNMQNTVLINNSRTTWPTKILMPFLSSSDNWLHDACIIFQKSVDNFEIEHKTC